MKKTHRLVSARSLLVPTVAADHPTDGPIHRFPATSQAPAVFKMKSGGSATSPLKTGTVAFRSQGGATFRYKLTDSRIWLENQKTKYQW